MVEENLEPTQVPVEPTEPTSIQEPTEPVSPEPTEPVSEPTEPIPPAPPITEEDVTQRLGSAEKEWQSRKDKEFQEFQDKIRDLEKQARLSSLSSREAKELESWGDTTEVKEFHTERRKFLEEQTEFDSKKQSQEVLATQLNEQAKGVKAHELSKEYGVERKDLLECKTPEEMETKAVKLAFDTMRSELEEAKKSPQKVDSGATTVPGVDYSKMSARELIQADIEERKNK